MIIPSQFQERTKCERLFEYEAYLEDNVGAWGPLEGPLAVCKLGISAIAIIQSRALDLATVELVHVLGALGLTVELVTPIAAVILTIAKIGVIDTLAIAAVLGSPGTGLDLAHEGQQSLAPNDSDDSDPGHH